jgi:uncharacterized protein YrrD
MTWKVSELKGDDVLSRDGSIGTLDDVYFDDESWRVRYMVVDTGGWVGGRRMLIAPAAIESALSDPAGRLRVGASRDELMEAPDAASHPPVAQQERTDQARRLGPPYYWSDATLWGTHGKPSAAERDPHLRSSNEVLGFHVQAADGELGSVRDLLIDESTWQVDGMVIDIRKWWPGGEVRLLPDDIERIDSAGRKVHLRLTRDEARKG